MSTTLTRENASALIKKKIVNDDRNDFEKTESSFGSPLSVRTSESKTVDEKRCLSLDSTLRKKETKISNDDDALLPTGYIIPTTRTVRIETLSAALAERNKMAVADFLSNAFSIFPDLIPTGGTVASKTPASTLADLTDSVKSLDFTIDLWNIFNQLDNSKVIYVEAPNDPYVGLFIIGEATDGLVIAQSILVQT